MPWTMPAETEPHTRTWMAWPSADYTLGDRAEEAWVTWAAVANAIVAFEPVTMIVAPEHREVASRYLAPEVDLVEGAVDDGWYRDSGPTFVLGESGLGAVNWVFNGWGGQDWASWENDAVASLIATEAAGAARIDSAMVNEGGGIHTDGEGTFLVTRTVQLDPGRNPELTEADVEAELVRTLGARRVIWLPRGLTRDSERFGTRGHVDIVATFPSPGTVLLHDQQDPEHPDFQVCQELRASLAGVTDAEGRELEIVSLPAPTVLRDDEGWVDYSYVNHLVCNGAVIGCAFDDPNDEVAREVLATAYPGREIVMVDARPLFARGGGIHCITQQQPAVPGASVA
ncbi:agmatine deiminase family protein [Demequina mangrovi]|uniref:Agmatine deiminase n=1 Tax=Demequina mangrovi TaxID=1043493 RepID=A0A1H6ZZC6_9MICO|nr:agmatine deiminase family protein [Demequina mangrovi]SEJ58793.1 agmatine deiminase [Demequina mangrovi]